MGQGKKTHCSVKYVVKICAIKRYRRTTSYAKHLFSVDINATEADLHKR